MASLSNYDPAALHAAVLEKNKQFWFDYRAVNGFYIYGGRKEPVRRRELPGRVRQAAEDGRGARRTHLEGRPRREPVPATIDDSGTGEFTVIKSNVDKPIELTTAAQTLASFKLPEGFKAEVFADETAFPDLKNPCQFCFDGDGRLWVCTMQSYPMYLPGTPPNDKVLILEDTDGDGKADKQTIFAEGLHLPAGIELGDGGAYVAQQPNLVFLKDTNGDDKADEKTIVLERLRLGRQSPRDQRLHLGAGRRTLLSGRDVPPQPDRDPLRPGAAGERRHLPLGADGPGSSTSSSPTASPTRGAIASTDWGQDFLADASGGANYFATAFSAATSTSPASTARSSSS